MHDAPVVGIFVGGAGRRMGGVPKGLLVAPDGHALVERLLAAVRAVDRALPVVLVGAADAYAHLGLPALADDPAGVGPLGGLRALLRHAAAEGRASAIALACDLPRFGPELLRRLVHERGAALAFAPRDGELWSPLTAHYSVGALDAIDAALGAREHSLQRLFARLSHGAVECPLDARERDDLVDWDRPEDMER